MILALADDFSGAAEVAGVAHRHGLKAMVATTQPIPSVAEFVAVDMATRSLSAAEAIKKAKSWGKIAAEITPSLLYKKTDSVLRGHVGEELFSMLGSTGRGLGLLIPANPARNRTIAKGEYRIDDVPLAQTEFARDPAFPICSSRVTDLVKGATSLIGRTPWPDKGLAIGDALDESDLDEWAERLPDNALPAGASPFLAALLRNQGLRASFQAMPKELMGQKVLLVCGSQSDSAQKIIGSLTENGAPIFGTTGASENESAQEIAKALGENPVTVVRHPPETSHSSQELTEKIASITQKALQLYAKPSIHLCLEGGETAAAVLKQLGKESFTALHEWEPGVVTLVTDNQLPVTVKPGSYPWPTKLLGCGSS